MSDGEPPQRHRPSCVPRLSMPMPPPSMRRRWRCHSDGTLLSFFFSSFSDRDTLAPPSSTRPSPSLRTSLPSTRRRRRHHSEGTSQLFFFFFFRFFFTLTIAHQGAARHGRRDTDGATRAPLPVRHGRRNTARATQAARHRPVRHGRHGRRDTGSATWGTATRQAPHGRRDNGRHARCDTGTHDTADTPGATRAVHEGWQQCRGYTGLNLGLIV